MTPTDTPLRGARLRADIHAGYIHLLPPTLATRALVAEARALLESTPGPRRAPAEIYAHAQAARARVLSDGGVRAAVRAILEDLGFALAEHALHPPRLRAIQSGAHELPEAAAAYFAHRDTWYGNPRAQVNLWVPLYDVAEEETFTFFPSAFARAVENDSASFDYATWRETVGWQKAGGASRGAYPRALGSLAHEERMGFAAEAGALLLFSAAHLHQTRAHTTGRTRYSVDFRVVHRQDHRAGRGAPDVDNRATGSALGDYVAAEER